MFITSQVQELVKAAISDGYPISSLIDDHLDYALEGDREARIVNSDIADELIKIEAVWRKANLI